MEGRREQEEKMGERETRVMEKRVGGQRRRVRGKECERKKGRKGGKEGRNESKCSQRRADPEGRGVSEEREGTGMMRFA